MARTESRPDLDELAARMRGQFDSLAGAMPAEGASHQVMNGFADAYRAWLEAVSSKPKSLIDLQGRYMKEQMRLWMDSMRPAEGKDTAGQPDKRFSAPEWEALPVFRYFRDSYLLTSKMMMQAAMESRGETLQEGVKNLLADMEKGRISMTDETAFEVGKNIAVSKGAVVWENELVQLIQYEPLTAKVHERALVMVPPCINKFYIMDLQPENSHVRYAVEQGHTVFMVSWRNVKKPLDRLTWDDYLETGVMAALDEARSITKSAKVNALGFCIGGTLLATALAVLEKKGKNPVASLTLLTTLLDFTDAGEIRVYIDEKFVEKREKQLEKGGLVPGQELAGAFSSLRANDLVWSYVVNNYLKGKQPPAFDLLFWNSDATNLPGPMYAYYLRNTYQDNKLAKPDALVNCGVPVSRKRVQLPPLGLP